MKKELLFTFYALFFLIFTGHSQSPLCGEVFTDAGGTGSNYANNSNYTVTICPTNPGEVVTVTFTNFNTESGFDGLFIYNGNSVNAPQISSGSSMPNLVGAFSGTNNPGTITSTSADGCLTFRFKSNASITSSGWIANISCGQSPSCVAPVAYNFSIFGYDNTLVNWTDLDNATQWEVIVLPSSQPAPNATDIGTIVNTNSYHAYGLNSATSYKVYSRSICSSTEKSVWSHSNNFSTLTCYSPSYNISNVTSNSVNVNLSTTESISWEIIVQPSSMAAPTNSSNGVMTTNNFETITNLLPFTQHKVYVRKHCTVNAKSNWSTETVFTTTNSSTCPMPTSIIKNGISSTSANLSWAVGTATQWEVLLQTAATPFPPISATGTIVNTNSYYVANLTTNVPYKFYVRTICSAGYISDWSSYSFTLFPILPLIVTNTTTYTHGQLVTNVLVNNPCITISNVTSSTGTNFGSTNGIGYFTNTNPTFPLTSGIVLSTGNVNNIPGPNTSILSDGVMTWTGDSELENIIMTTTGLTMSSKNATKLEFDFTSLNEFMSFNFLFASEEYGTYQCTYADAFAFLLTDLVTGVTTNLAIVPGTSAPISVVTIRENVFNYACSSVNPDFFDTFFAGTSNYLSATNFNGQTTEMTASSVIIPNHPYHIKLVIADRGDTALDSAVFIKAGSFTSGPPECYDKINLVAFADSNNNGIKETEEVNFSYGSFVSQQNNAGASSSIYSPIGTHTIYDSNPVNTYDFSYSLDAEYAGYYSSGTTSFNDISIAVGSGTQTLYFPISLTNPYNDVTVSIVPTSQPVPGFNYTNKVVYKNLGVAPANGQISFTKDANVMINTISVPGSVSTATGFTYDFANLQPYESRFINVSMSVPAIPVVNIDDTLTNSVSISTPSSDINSTNNLSTNTQIVVASYDPNDKMESHGEKIQFNQFAANDYLYYTIRFQNEGTANAISVRIEDLLDAQLDETSIRVISASHSYYMTKVGNLINWNFDFINLPPALANEELSKGYVFFKVKLKPGFSVGDIIPNTANIFFDTNPAIVTNTFNTEFVTALNNLDFNSGNFLLYPNPATDLVQVSLNVNSGNIESIVIFDVLGKIVKRVEAVNSNQTNMNVSDLSSGVYMVEVAAENDLKQVKKLIIK